VVTSTATARPPGVRLEPRLIAVLPPIAVAAIVVVNGWSGLMPGVGFWDTAEFQTVLPILGTAHPTGYPTYVLLGFLGNLLLTPIGEPAFRINVLSLLAVGVAAGTTMALVRRLTGSTVIGIAAGLALATTPLVWQYAMAADPHPIHLAFVALLLLALVKWEHARRDAADAAGDDVAGGPMGEGGRPDTRRADRWLVLAAVLFGLAAGNHSLTLLFIPPIGLYVLAVEPGIWRRWRFVLTCLGAAVLTLALVFLELPVRGGLIPALTAPLVYARPGTWNGFWDIALAEQFRGSLGNPFADLPAKWDGLLALGTGQFGLLAIAIPPAFLATFRRAPRYALLTGLAFLITVLFDAAYANADIKRYYLGPILLAWTWLGVLAADLAFAAGFLGAGVVERMRRLRLGDQAVDLAARGAAIVLGVVLVWPAIATLGARRDAVDRSGDTHAQRWLAQVLQLIPDNAVLVSWWSTSTPLWYAQKVEAQRPDIFIVDDRTMLDLDLGRAPDVIERYLGEHRPVYVIRLPGRDTDELTAQFDMTVIAGEGSDAVWQVHGRLVAAQ
jgi:4-amino-4-deoxy-L-arabinose transferase-like glycosyltransferase